VSSAALSAAHGSRGSSGLAAPHSPKPVAKSHHKEATAAATKRITFDLPEDAEEEEREVAEEAAAHDQELAGKAAAAAAAAKGQLAVPGSGGVLTPTNTLAEGLADAPAQATTDALAAAARKLTIGAAAAGAGAKGKVLVNSGHDADVHSARDDQDEAVVWATVVEKQGGLHAGEAGAISQSQGSDARHPFKLSNRTTSRHSR
jgi:hypothetical protein